MDAKPLGLIPEETPPALGRGQRWAGAYLLLLAVQMAVAWRLGLVHGLPVVSAPLDALLGIALLRGFVPAVRWARWRAWLGLLVSLGGLFLALDPARNLFVPGLLAGLLLLLHSDRERLRLYFGSLLCAGGLMLSTLALMVLGAPIRKLLPLEYRQRMDELRGNVARTRDGRVELHLPTARWCALRPAEIRQPSLQLLALSVFDRLTVRVEEEPSRLDLRGALLLEEGPVRRWELPPGTLLQHRAICLVKARSGLVLSVYGPAETYPVWGQRMAEVIESFPRRTEPK